MIDATTPEILAFVAGVLALNQAKVSKNAVITVDVNPKYLRIIRTDGTSRSVHCFIDRQTGDILKAASWKAPAPRGKRGSIFTPDNGLSCVNFCGTWGLR